MINRYYSTVWIHKNHVYFQVVDAVTVSKYNLGNLILLYVLFVCVYSIFHGHPIFINLLAEKSPFSVFVHKIIDTNREKHFLGQKREKHDPTIIFVLQAYTLH